MRKIILPIFLFCGCVESNTASKSSAPPKIEGRFANGTDSNSTEFVPPVGVVTKAQLVQMFAETCLRYFPDEKEVRRAFTRSKIVDDGYPYKDITKSVQGSISVGEIADLEIRFLDCRITATVKDPQTDWGPLLSNFAIPSNEVIWSDSDTGKYRIQDKEINLYIHGPDLADKANLGPVTGKHICGNRENCIAYEPVQLSVSMDLSYY